MINEEYYLKIKNNWDNLAKPLDSMGYFEDILSKMGAVLLDETIDISKAALAVFISDNGIINEGVSQSTYEVTTSVARAIGRRKSSVCHMAENAKVDVFPYNIGMVESEKIDGVDDSYFIANGSKNFALEPALSLVEVQTAIDSGKKIVGTLVAKGYKTVLLGEMGIGNTTTSSAVIASILKLDPIYICGRGAGLSDEGLDKKINVIKNAIKKYDLYNAAPLTILSSVGGFDIAAMVGVILGALEYKIPIILDGLITAAAALVARELDKDTSGIVFFSHKGKEKGIELVAREFDQIPIIDGNMALGEGTGAVMFYSCLKNALSIYSGNTSFSDMEIDKYERFQ